MPQTVCRDAMIGCVAIRVCRLASLCREHAHTWVMMNLPLTNFVTQLKERKALQAQLEYSQMTT